MPCSTGGLGYAQCYASFAQQTGLLLKETKAENRVVHTAQEMMSKVCAHAGVMDGSRAARAGAPALGPLQATSPGEPSGPYSIDCAWEELHAFTAKLYILSQQHQTSVATFPYLAHI